MLPQTSPMESIYTSNIMDKNTEQTIISASQALSILSKVRCVEHYSFDPCTKFKNLYSWPSHFIGSQEVLRVLDSKKIQYLEPTRVKAYPVSYDSYRSYIPIVIPEITEIKFVRTLLQIFFLIQKSQDIIKVTASWDFLNNRNHSLPTSFHDTNALQKFAQYRDSMLILQYEGSNFDIKLPAYSYRALMMAIDSIQQLPINIEDRSRFVGGDTDEKGRSKRFIVHKGNLEYLRKTLKKTALNINKLVGEHDWMKALRADGHHFESYK